MMKIMTKLALFSFCIFTGSFTQAAEGDLTREVTLLRSWMLQSSPRDIRETGDNVFGLVWYPRMLSWSVRSELISASLQYTVPENVLEKYEAASTTPPVANKFSSRSNYRCVSYFASNDDSINSAFFQGSLEQDGSHLRFETKQVNKSGKPYQLSMIRFPDWKFDRAFANRTIQFNWESSMGEWLVQSQSIVLSRSILPIWPAGSIAQPDEEVPANEDQFRKLDKECLRRNTGGYRPTCGLAASIARIRFQADGSFFVFDARTLGEVGTNAYPPASRGSTKVRDTELARASTLFSCEPIDQ